MDLGNPDDEIRKTAVDTFKKSLAFNKVLGASIVGSETAYPHLNEEEKKVWYPYMMDSIRLKLIFDPANVLEHPEIDQERYWREWMSELGDKIEAVHMKDFVIGPEGEYCPVCLGEGVIRYGGIIRWLKENRSDIVIVREELDPMTAQRDIRYMRELWQSA